MASKEKTISKKLRIERTYPETLQSHFVSNIVVQHQPDFFVLSFFEVWPPAIIGETDKEKQQELEGLDHVDAKCIARLVVTPSKMKEFIETMSNNMANYEKMIHDQRGS